eukprot:13509732-Alexandrium_andersonii.AAC.1
MLCNWGPGPQFPSDLGTSGPWSPNGRPSVRAEARSARRVLGVRGGRSCYTKSAPRLRPHLSKASGETCPTSTRGSVDPAREPQEW